MLYILPLMQPKIQMLKSYFIQSRLFERIKKLCHRDRQLLAIWLSRYCFASRATLKEFEAARDVVLVQAIAIQKIVLPYSAVNVTPP